MTTLARSLARRLLELRDRPLPAEVAQAAMLHFTDALGVGLAASRSTAGRPYILFSEQIPLGGPCSVFGSGRRASAADAATSGERTFATTLRASNAIVRDVLPTLVMTPVASM